MGEPTGVRDGKPDAVVVVTHTPSRVDRGRKFAIPAHGIVLGGAGCDVEVDGARESGSRLELRWLGQQPENGEWHAHALGRVRVNGEVTDQRRLTTGDEIRVVDTYFRFLCGPELERQYHETIYHLTIFDMPTGLANVRYLKEALDRDVSRARNDKRPIALAVFMYEAEPSPTTTSHDIVRELAHEIRAQAPPAWFAARNGDFEVVIVALGTTSAELARHARLWLASRGAGHVGWRFGVAELDAAIPDATALLAAARARVSLS
jgi:GGDEF domain-containing protein